MPYLMPIYTTIVGLVIGYLFGKVRELAKKKAETKSEEAKTLALLKDGMAMLLRAQIEGFYQEYKDAEAIPPDRWEYFIKEDKQDSAGMEQSRSTERYSQRRNCCSR